MSARMMQTAAGLLACGLVGTAIGVAQDEAPTTAPQPEKMSRSELRDRQLDVSLEARDIERILTKLKRASDLAKERITEAATTAEAVSSSLETGDSQAAREKAEEAAAMFQEIVRQLEALLAEETPQRVAAARNLAAQLSRMERQFSQQLQNAKNPQANGRGQGDPKSDKSNPQGQGGGKKTDSDKPKGAAGERKPSDDDMPKDGEAGEKPKDAADPKSDQPMNGTGAKDETDPKADQPMSGAGDSKSDEEKDQPGAAEGKPKDEASEEPKPGAGQGDAEKKPQDDPMGAGSGEAKDEPTDEKPAGRGAGPRRPMTEEERREALARRAEELANKGETLLDILKAIAESTEPADQEAAGKINALLKETNLEEAIAAMQDAAEQIQSRELDDARLAALDIADRMEITAQRLDQAYRTIVAPQAEELRQLEEDLAMLSLKLEDLQTQSQVLAWHREMRELLDRADELGVSETAREELLDAMQKAGFSLDGDRSQFNWNLANGRYQIPQGYAIPLRQLQEDIQTRIQGLLLGDIVTAADDATPPKYQGLVERYYQVLSKDGGEKSSNALRNARSTRAAP